MTQPQVNFISWVRIVPQLLTITLLVVIIQMLLPSRDYGTALIVGGAIFIVYAFGSRFFIAAANRRGLRAVSKNDYDAALKHFEDSYAFFSKHAWLDRFRVVTLMSPSIWSYKEMALMNIATVHVRREDFAAAKTACERVLSEFPENEIAASTLAVLRSSSE